MYARGIKKRTFFSSLNGRFQPRREAEAQRTLEDVGCKPMLSHLFLEVCTQPKAVNASIADLVLIVFRFLRRSIYRCL